MHTFHSRDKKKPPPPPLGNLYFIHKLNQLHNFHYCHIWMSFRIVILSYMQQPSSHYCFIHLSQLHSLCTSVIFEAKRTQEIVSVDKNPIVKQMSQYVHNMKESCTYLHLNMVGRLEEQNGIWKMHFLLCLLLPICKCNQIQIDRAELRLQIGVPFGYLNYMASSMT